MTKHMNWKSWEPKTQEGKEAKVAYIALEANQKAARMRGLTDAQRKAYAEELIAEYKKKYYPNGLAKEPSALDKALARVKSQQQAEQQYRDNQGRFSDDTDHTLFDEPTDVLPPRGQY